MNLFNSLAVSGQKAHIKRAHVFAQYVENGWESDKFEGFVVINRAVNHEEANGWAFVKASDHKAIWEWCLPWYKGSKMMMRSFLFLNKWISCCT